jgi:hypothetical protein
MNRNDIHVFFFYFFVLYSLKAIRRRALTVETKGQGPGAKRKPVALLSLTAKNARIYYDDDYYYYYYKRE